MGFSRKIKINQAEQRIPQTINRPKPNHQPTSPNQLQLLIRNSTLTHKTIIPANKNLNLLHKKDRPPPVQLPTLILKPVQPHPALIIKNVLNLHQATIHVVGQRSNLPPTAQQDPRNHQRPQQGKTHPFEVLLIHDKI
jgi:hypothetical protein